jgi:hypothetical protein
MSFYERVWPEMLHGRAFSMRSPATNGPLILEAMRKGETAMQRMANMVLATKAAAKRSLSNDLRERLSLIAAKRGKPDATENSFLRPSADLRHKPIDRLSSRLPRRFPVGAKYVVEGYGGKEGKLRVIARYVVLPGGQWINVPAGIAAGPGAQPPNSERSQGRF